jgi:pilus assembly protein CpaC
VTISGQEATFLAGGEVFIPVPQSSSGGATAITLQEEEFGVGLKFTPTVLGNGRLNLRVAPEVSELSPTGVTLSATNVSGTSILPLITTRRASTTVQMNDGESFAIGGLISNNVTGALKAIPGIGEVPILGALFRSTSFQQDRSELVFIITAHLVKPQPSSKYSAPTDSFTQVNEADVYATGNMEGRAAAYKKSTAPAGAAPNSPQMQSPAPADASSPSQAPHAPATPDNSALVPPSAPAVEVAPVSAIPPGTAAEQADAKLAAANELAARVARIEHEAALIAARETQERLALANGPNETEPPDIAAPPPPPPVSTPEDQAERAERIEREAARIAANEAREQFAKAGQWGNELEQ